MSSKLMASLPLDETIANRHSGAEPAPYPDTGPESRGAGWWSTPSPSMGEG